MKDSYELQCARLARNEWKRVAGKMYGLIKAGEIRDAETTYEEFAYTYTKEDR